MSIDPLRTEPTTTNGKSMAIAGLVCSLGVIPITTLLIPLYNLSASSDTAGYIFFFSLPAGAILWVVGLFLSLRAKNRARRWHRLAKAGVIISGLTPMIFLAVLLLLVIQVMNDWYYDCRLEQWQRRALESLLGL